MNLGFTNEELFNGRIFVLLAGPPGCGKTTYAEAICKRYMNFEKISPDDIRKELYGDMADQSHNPEVFTRVYDRISLYLDNDCNIVYDATNCRSSYRTKMVDFVANKAAKLVCIHFVTPVSKCLEQNGKRDRHVPDEVLENMWYSLKKHPPTVYEGYDIIFRER